MASTDDVLDLDVLRPGFTTDPYPVFAELRAATPVRQIRIFGVRSWLLSRYSDVRAALVNPAVSNDPGRASDEIKAHPRFAAGFLGPLAKQMTMSDPPTHTRLRRLVSKEFTPRRIEALRPRVEQLAEELLSRFLPVGEVDLIEEFAAPLPITVIMDLLGVPDENRSDVRRWADIITGTHLVGHEELARGLAETRAFLVSLIEQKSRRQGFAETDLLGALIADRDDDRLTRDELLSMAFVLMVAGYTTTLDLIGNGAIALLRNPDQLAALRADPSLLEGAIEEFLRYDAPVPHGSYRVATQDIEIGGTTIPAGDLILLGLSASNRDPARFAEPDRLDIARNDSGHLSFGHGAHYCIGAPLARMEATIALRLLLDRCTNLALAGDVELTWRVSRQVRGVTRLPLTFTPA